KCVSEAIAHLIENDGNLHAIHMTNGDIIQAERGFVAFGGNEVRSELAQRLGVQLHENKHIIVNPRTKMTNVEHVWSAGDVVEHSEQVTIAMGDGMQAAIWIHKSLQGISVPQGQ